MCKAKLLQFVSGVNVFTFWITSFLWDYLTFMFTVALLICTLVSFQEEGWSTAAELGRTSIILLLFGFAMLPMMYIGSMFFTVPSTGFVRMTLFNICTGKFYKKRKKNHVDLLMIAIFLYFRRNCVFHCPLFAVNSTI